MVGGDCCLSDVEEAAQLPQDSGGEPCGPLFEFRTARTSTQATQPWNMTFAQATVLIDVSEIASTYSGVLSMTVNRRVNHGTQPTGPTRSRRMCANCLAFTRLRCSVGWKWQVNLCTLAVKAARGPDRQLLSTSLQIYLD
jgi:hypothetical protein